MVYQEMGPHDYPNKTIFFGWCLLNNAFGTPRLVSFVLPSAFCFSAQLFTGTWLEKSGVRSPVGGVGEEELCLENPCRGSSGCGRRSIAKAVSEGLNNFDSILKLRRKHQNSPVLFSWLLSLQSFSSFCIFLPFGWLTTELTSVEFWGSMKSGHTRTAHVGDVGWLNGQWLQVASLFLKISDSVSCDCVKRNCLVTQKNPGIGILGGGFKYFLLSPLFGEDSHFD